MLPPELWHLIFWWLDWDSIYELEETCRGAWAASRCYSGRTHPEPNLRILWRDPRMVSSRHPTVIRRQYTITEAAYKVTTYVTGCQSYVDRIRGIPSYGTRSCF